MLVVCLLTPLIMVIFGRAFSRKAPAEINMSFGYRTDMSMKNRDTWNFAHKYLGKLWLVSGLILLPLSVIPFVFVIGENVELIGILSMIIVGVQLIVVIATIFPTEAALKRNFNKNGSRIK